MAKRKVNAKESLKIYMDTLRLLRNIEKATDDFRNYVKSITESIDIDIPDFITEKRNWSLGCAIDRCHTKIGEYVEINDKVKE